ncbi:uncharacterized protein B0H64DRAFT_466327 [Chaetomium fimeti]|uniref:Carrier domain-containing protein n=1 Tax=Chaetomium fimeti TaxID=1854472 RepID=A0AAE0HDQ0_9PEZI|nr:hypothetical protein B0H64DRAFT_466327 [Chaetomium fimeti]
MHLRESPFDTVGLGNGTNPQSRETIPLSPPITPVEAVRVVARTVSLREAPGSRIGDGGPFRQNELLLAWALLLQRQRGADSRVDQLVWGYRCPDGIETAERLSLSAAGIELSPMSTRIISDITEVVAETTQRVSAVQPSSLFFNDEAQGGVLQKGSNQPQWTFQLNVTEEAGVFTMKGLWHTGSGLTQQQATDRVETFIDLLETISQQPGSPISSLLELLPRDLDQIWTWNSALPPTIDRTMHDIISEQSEAHPDKVALSSWDGQWTYAELETLSTRLAHHLTSRGVEVGTIVPLCFEKNRWTIIALLAVMKAGGAFALTDPTSQPEARMRTMAEQTGARLIVASEAQSDLAGRLTPPDGGEVVTVSEASLASLLPTPSSTNPLPALPPYTTTTTPPLPTIPPTSPLYIQFTSGSTGKPKGVVISHGNYTSGALPRATAVGYTSTSRVFEFASYAFDVSIDCMLCTLAAGGTICIPSDSARMNDLGGAIRTSGANMAHMTPSVARVLDPGVIAGLEVLGLGGEAVSAADAAAWGRGGTSVVIAYGPSEWPVVGLGYLGEPEKTAEVFIEDPAWLLAGYGSNPGRRGRLYKTGDLVRYDPEGSGDLVFVGRKDSQVKLRGQRVELVEIEHHLRRHLPSEVKLAAEVIKPTGGEPTLVTFVSEPFPGRARPNGPGEESEGQELTFSEEMVQALSGIDEVLGVELPRYMVPAAYIPLLEMPSLPSAKIDRKKLRAIGAATTREQIASSSRRAQRAETGEASTATERALLRVWKTLLGDQTDISVGDSFFALGGDSLRAMRLVAAARAEGIVLTVADVFRYPVLRDMAVIAQTATLGRSEDFDTVLPFSLLPDDWLLEEAREEASKHCNISPADVEDIYPCTPLQEALMALSAKAKEAYVAQRVLKMESLEAAETLQAAFEAIAADSPVLRTRVIQASQHGLMQVVVDEPIVWRSGRSLAEYLEHDRDEQMGLGGPLVRYAMIRAGQVAHFVLTMHHALYDGWSMPLVVDRVNQVYQGLSARRPAADFKHFIHYLNKRLDRDACDTYWRDQLAGATGQQFPRLPFEGYQTQADTLLEVDISLEGRRLPACRNATVTLATVIRAAWAVVASQYCSGNTDIVFGETLTGRNAPLVGVEEIEGPMITTVPVRVSIDRDATVEEYLQSIAQQAVTQIPYEHAGLQHIRRLSDDALQACELRTGFVMHPATGDVPADDKTPANGLVPAGDSEAAQEALKFNTYALMLVCSLSADGFFVMASFDSKTVDKATMSRALEQLRVVVHQLCEGNERGIKVRDVHCLTEVDETEVQMLSQQAAVDDASLARLGLAKDDVGGVWIVDAVDSQRLLPRGAVGELVVQTGKSLAAPAVAIDRPQWLDGKGGRLYRTGFLATFGSNTDKPTLQILKSTKAMGQEVGAKRVPSSAPAVTATSTKQKMLRRIWSQLLNISEDGIYLGDSFFTRGGDSITAMKLVSEARQQGMQLSVAQVFANRTLYEMANVMQPSPTDAEEQRAITTRPNANYKAFSLFFNIFKQRIQSMLQDRSWNIVDVLPTRPLQEIAVKGTVELPRFSIRYELIHFEGTVDKARLFSACREVVARNEILRTVFVRLEGVCFSVVLDDSFAVPVVEYEIDDDEVEPFARQLSSLDSKTRMPYGSSFTKWFFVTNGTKSTLVFRLSHAQYDEIGLPIFLNQLHQLYQGSASIPAAYPFSAFVNHTLRHGIPAAIPYWRDLLAGAKGISILRPPTPITSRRHFALHRAVDISPRARDITVASYPSAAWALTLARLLGTNDVVFGEIASGRGVDIAGVPDANAVAGPCWQYVPTRVRFGGGLRTGHDLLAALQHQHMATSSHDCMGLEEIVRECTDWDADGVDWFDSVVHQDVAHVETLQFLGRKAKMETVYPYEEPLREWKIQAFRDGETLTLEVVTFKSWSEHAARLLDALVAGMEQLVQRPWEELDVV